MSRAPIAAGALVTALVFLAAGYRWFAVACVMAGIMGVYRIGPQIDPMRFFPTEDRRAIFDRAAGRCEWPGCGIKVHFGTDCPDPDGSCRACYEADHLVAWSRGGRTTLSNGACLCSYHNGLKSDR